MPQREPRPWFRVLALADPAVADVEVYDQIARPWFPGEEGVVGAKDFLGRLAQLPDSVRTIRLHVNSPGGEVSEALTIANGLRAQRVERGRKVEALVEGVAASAATLITSAADRVLMPDNALMMVHNPSAVVMGQAVDLRREAEALDRYRLAMIATYQWISPKSADDLGAMLDAETWMTADEAVAAGLAHEVVPGSTANATWDPTCLGTIPARVLPLLSAMLPPAAEGIAPPKRDESTRGTARTEMEDQAMTELETLQAKLAEAEAKAKAAEAKAEIEGKAAAQLRAEQLVDKAIQRGAVRPADRDATIQDAVAAPEVTARVLARTPDGHAVPLGLVGQAAPATGAPTTPTLTTEQAKAAEQLGLSPQTYADLGLKHPDVRAIWAARAKAQA